MMAHNVAIVAMCAKVAAWALLNSTDALVVVVVSPPSTDTQFPRLSLVRAKATWQRHWSGLVLLCTHAVIRVA
jgi:hypothetical protein